MSSSLNEREYYNLWFKELGEIQCAEVDTIDGARMLKSAIEGANLEFIECQHVIMVKRSNRVEL